MDLDLAEPDAAAFAVQFVENYQGQDIVLNEELGIKLTTKKFPELKEYILDVISKSIHHGGFAIGTGNSIPNYVPTDKYLDMLEIIREYRGDYK